MGDSVNKYLRNELLAIAANIDKGRNTNTESTSASNVKAKVNKNDKHESEDCAAFQE